MACLKKLYVLLDLLGSKFFKFIVQKSDWRKRLETDKLICFDFDDNQPSLPDFFAVARIEMHRKIRENAALKSFVN